MNLTGKYTVGVKISQWLKKCKSSIFREVLICCIDSLYHPAVYHGRREYICEIIIQLQMQGRVFERN